MNKINRSSKLDKPLKLSQQTFDSFAMEVTKQVIKIQKERRGAQIYQGGSRQMKSRNCPVFRKEIDKVGNIETSL